MSPINILCGNYKYIHKIKTYTLTVEPLQETKKILKSYLLI